MQPLNRTLLTKPKGILIVKNLREARPPRHYPSEFGYAWLTYIPLLPYVKMPYERLDESDKIHQERKGNNLRNNKNFVELISKGIADDLVRSGLFAEVRYVGDESIPVDANYVLTGELISTEFDKYLTSYMLGMAGVLLWTAPIPIGSNGAIVEANLTMTDSSGASVWSHKLVGKASKVFTLYNSGGAPISSQYTLVIKHYGSNDEGIDGDSVWAYHAAALRSGMVGVKLSLAKGLAGK